MLSRRKPRPVAIPVHSQSSAACKIVFRTQGCFDRGSRGFWKRTSDGPAFRDISIIQRPCGPGVAESYREDDPLPVQLADSDGKSRRGHRIGKLKSPLPIRRNQRTLQPKSDVARVLLERPDASFSPDVSNAMENDSQFSCKSDFGALHLPALRHVERPALQARKADRTRQHDISLCVAITKSVRIGDEVRRGLRVI